ncbi:DEAD/DEAH box helicase [Lutibacter citreus]|uniref:DEAD/DEAH box helicase n=1 Tax=Lutibacter citreus TaxID=2138210 RepID=UPI000DBE0AB2|nr:DEAD/DEAH box helicase [Lutibacter citreus]
MTLSTIELEEKNTGKQLYSYQKEAISKIFKRFEEAPNDYHLLFQLPTGGGKTVIFSELVRQYIKHHKSKVLILTHRIELCKQTCTMLSDFGVVNKVIDSKANLDDHRDYSCYVAMVETLNNRLNDNKLDISDIGLVIIDEAHYNSFTKLFKFFHKSFILGVTATPLSSNIQLPMTDNYEELIIGESIETLIKSNFLARAKTYSYNVGLTSLVVGANGDYTVKSSDDLYSNSDMLNKLVQAYEERSKGKKTLIFNNGINTSINVFEAFKMAGYPVMHLDNTANKREREFILRWFKMTPNAILTSVSILTTGFDEPTVDTIILNRATRSLTLYYQMIGRGSRILKDKTTFNVIDLGNNFHRFGMWGANLNWNKIFKSPNYYLDNLLNDEDLESNFRYEMPKELRDKFSKTEDVFFNIKEAYIDAIKIGESSKVVLSRSIDQHARICTENSEDVYDALILAQEIGDDIDHRIQQYLKCICKSTNSFTDWLKEDYRKKLRAHLLANFDTIFEEINGYPPEE